jgi:hypothetical protein
MSRQYIIETLNSAVLDALGSFTGIVDSFNEEGPQPDLANQSRPWLAFGVVIDGRAQASLAMAGRQVKRFRGGIQVGTFEKVGTGTFQTTAVLDALDLALANRSVGGIIVGDAHSYRPQQYGDWNPSGVQYLFYYDVTD